MEGHNVPAPDPVKDPAKEPAKDPAKDPVKKTAKEQNEVTPRLPPRTLDVESILLEALRKRADFKDDFLHLPIPRNLGLKQILTKDGCCAILVGQLRNPQGAQISRSSNLNPDVWASVKFHPGQYASGCSVKYFANFEHGQPMNIRNFSEIRLLSPFDAIRSGVSEDQFIKHNRMIVLFYLMEMKTFKTIPITRDSISQFMLACKCIAEDARKTNKRKPLGRKSQISKLEGRDPTTSKDPEDSVGSAPNLNNNQISMPLPINNPEAGSTKQSVHQEVGSIFETKHSSEVNLAPRPLKRSRPEVIQPRQGAAILKRDREPDNDDEGKEGTPKRQHTDDYLYYFHKLVEQIRHDDDEKYKQLETEHSGLKRQFAAMKGLCGKYESTATFFELQKKHSETRRMRVEARHKIRECEWENSVKIANDARIKAEKELAEMASEKEIRVKVEKERDELKKELNKLNSFKTGLLALGASLPKN